MEGYLVDVWGEAHFVKDFLEVQVVATDVETQFVQDHLQLVLELSAVCPIREVALEDWMNKYLVPRDTVFFMHLQTPSQEILGLGRKVLSLDIERLLLDIPDQLDFIIGSPGSFSVKQLEEDEP